MQIFDRSKVPAPLTLLGDEAQANRSRLLEFFSESFEKQAQSKVERSEYASAPAASAEAFLQVADLGGPSEPTMDGALARLFRGKCSFCEQKVRTAPFRLRPAAEALPYTQTEHGHLYYAWLADAWNNFYAICFECHGMSKQVGYFPVVGPRAPLPTRRQIEAYLQRTDGLWPQPPKEKALLLDPCLDQDFARHFHVSTAGLLTTRTAHARETLERFALNRPLLVMQRAEAFKIGLDFVKRRDWEGAKVANYFDFPRANFGGTWYLLLRQLTLILAGSQRGLQATPGRLPRTLELLGEQPDFARLCEAALLKMGRDQAGAGIAARQLASDAPPAQLRGVHIRNFKSLEDLTITFPEPKPLTDTSDDPPPASSILILGENAAGKSSILEAVALALAPEAARQNLDLDWRTLVLNPRFLGSQQEAPLEAQVQLRLESGSVSTQISAVGCTDSFHGRTLPPVFAYGAFRHYRSKVHQATPASSIETLFHPEIVLSNPEKWLLGLTDVRFAMVVRALREIFQVEENFEVIQRDPAEKRCYIVTETDRGNGLGKVVTRSPMSVASSGFRAILAMACDVMQGLFAHGGEKFESLHRARAVVLIDEIEAHLHPRWKMQVMRGLRRALPGVTFIASTHDPLCMRGMEHGEIMVLQRVATEAGTVGLPVKVEQLVNLPNLNRLTIEQLLTSEFFQLLSTDAPELDLQLARAADIHAKEKKGLPLSGAEQAALRYLQNEISIELPVGSSEVRRLIQEAVVLYLQNRRTATGEQMRALRAAAREGIAKALENL